MYSPDKNGSDSQRLLRYVDALREGVANEMERDPRVFVFGLDVDDHKAIQGSTRGLQQQFGRDRVFNTPLSEDAMTGIAIGAAIAGLRPIHVHIRMDFLMLCMNQLVNMASKAHYMYGGTVRVPMVVRSMIGKSWTRFGWRHWISIQFCNRSGKLGGCWLSTMPGLTAEPVRKLSRELRSKPGSNPCRWRVWDLRPPRVLPARYLNRSSIQTQQKSLPGSTR